MSDEPKTAAKAWTDTEKASSNHPDLSYIADDT